MIRWGVVVGIACAGFGLSGCSKSNPDDAILVGAYLSLSGPDSTFGSDSREGIELAVDEINAAGGVRGKKLKVLYEDDKSTTQEASQKVRQLIDRDHVVALLGEVASSRSLAGGLIANTSKVPMLTPSSTAVDVTKGREWVFRSCPTDDAQGAVLAKLIKTTLGKGKVGIFYAAQDTYSSGLAGSFREAYKALGGQIVVDKGYPKGETNFRTYLGDFKQAAPDAIFVPNYYNEMVLIARQAKELSIPGSIFVGADGWPSQNLLEGAGAELEGAYFTDHYAPDVPWETSKKFLAAYTGRFKHDPTTLGAQGYDGTKLLADAIGRASAATPDAIRQALLQTKNFDGATGPTTINAERNADKPFVVVQIKNKKFTYAQQIAVGAPGPPPASSGASDGGGH